MRPSFVIVVGAVASASAASSGLWPRQQFPSCSSSCLAKPNYGGCQPNDYNCLCKTSIYLNTLNSCLANSCSGVGLQDAVSAEKMMCSVVGISLTNSLPRSTAASSTTTSTASAATHTSNTAAAKSVTCSGLTVLMLGVLLLQ